MQRGATRNKLGTCWRYLLYILRIKTPVIVLTAFLILQNFVPITFLQVSPAHAALDIPNVVNYQATLQNSSGEYVTAPTDMKFVIYDASSGGNCLWTAGRNLRFADGREH